MLRKLRKMTGARVSPLAVSVASTRKNARVILKLNFIERFFALRTHGKRDARAPVRCVTSAIEIYRIKSPLVIMTLVF